jgi:hypothetical protein
MCPFSPSLHCTLHYLPERCQQPCRSGPFSFRRVSSENEEGKGEARRITLKQMTSTEVYPRHVNTRGNGTSRARGLGRREKNARGAGRRVLARAGEDNGKRPRLI